MMILSNRAKVIIICGFIVSLIKRNILLSSVSTYHMTNQYRYVAEMKKKLTDEHMTDHKWLCMLFDDVEYNRLFWCGVTPVIYSTAL